MDAHYRKLNDRSLNSSTYHKKDGTAVRAILKEELAKEYKELIGYDPFEDDPSQTEEEVTKILKEYKEEAARDA